jgi:Zn-dependent peptidase ImmA (M78 family)
MNSVVIASVRDLVPLRPMTYSEHLRIAELQAHRFLELVGVRGAPVPERVIVELPRLQVQRLSPFPVSGATHWFNGVWIVALNGSEPRVRQRFSLAHELKHILDHRFADLIYSSFPEQDRHMLIEHICDYFAGCLLMPRPWLKSTYAKGLQHLPTLARHFDVSLAAVQVRLNQIGMIDPRPRCGRPVADWRVRAIREAGETFYQREATPLFASEPQAA